MAKTSSKSQSSVLQQRPEEAPPGWNEFQEALALSSGLSILLVEGHQPPAISVSNNNSICNAFQSSPDHFKRCDPFCGTAHNRALSAGTAIEYKCHAGLQCFTQPIQIADRSELAVISGRAFVSSLDYQLLMERLRTGDLQDLATADFFSNIIFADRQRLEELSERIARATHQFKSVQENGNKPLIRSTNDVNLMHEVQRLRSELEYRSRLSNSLQHFLERISSDDPNETYNAILANASALLNSARASLMVFNENAKELVLKAAIGLRAEPASLDHVRTGEGISGAVIESGKPLLVEDIRKSEFTPAPAQRQYRTRSFISYPIAIGGRKVGVLSITDKAGGAIYDAVDLSLLEIIGPQIALALERAEWQERATEFQLMSITDPLTTLRNRRYLEERLTEELNRSKRYDYQMSFLMIDIDDFKTYNDTNGHQAGDLALQITAHCLKAALRSADVASRYGGEEFCILLPQTTISEAGVIADRIRQRVATTNFPHGKSQPLGRVSVSIGISTFSKIVNSAETVIAAADRALYRAKSLGKDRIEFYYDDRAEPPTTDERS